MLNQEKIQEIRQLDDDGSDSVLKTLIALFLTSTPPKLQKMQEGFEAKDFELVQKEAHSLRSSCLSLGAEVLAQYAFSVEYAQGNVHVINEGITRAQSEFELLKGELKKFQ